MGKKEDTSGDLHDDLRDRKSCILGPLPIEYFSCESGGIGRRTRLRIWRVKPWGFESPLSHQTLAVILIPRHVHLSRVALGAICGLVFGTIVVGIMRPMTLPDKKAAITAALSARFGIGFVIGAARLPRPGWCVGLLFGRLLSIPDGLLRNLTRQLGHGSGRRDPSSASSQSDSESSLAKPGKAPY